MLNKEVLVFLCMTLCYAGVKTELVQGSCREGYKQCTIGACLLDEYICDGVIQCPDDTDEKYCKNKPKLENADKLPIKEKLVQSNCIDGYVECEMGGICVQSKLVCDLKFQCPDKSDEKYCYEKPEEQTIPDMMDDVTPTAIRSSDEEEDPNSAEKEHGFRLSEEADHCAHYKRMILLVRRVHMKLVKMDQKTSKHFRHLINEILMEAGMESFSSLLELYHVCNSLEGIKEPGKHHKHHTTTTTTSSPSTPTTNYPPPSW